MPLVEHSDVSRKWLSAMVTAQQCEQIGGKGLAIARLFRVCCRMLYVVQDVSEDIVLRASTQANGRTGKDDRIQEPLLWPRVLLKIAPELVKIRCWHIKHSNLAHVEAPRHLELTGHSIVEGGPLSEQIVIPVGLACIPSEASEPCELRHRAKLAVVPFDKKRRVPDQPILGCLALCRVAVSKMMHAYGPWQGGRSGLGSGCQGTLVAQPSVQRSDHILPICQSAITSKPEGKPG
mmetsp:Transcript_44874/g.117722  ORF Transcript_44874/g.117722 Transcript_44874/m.117722 type:complete len:235 (-) Transcript_44874:588-1292(-)